MSTSTTWFPKSFYSDPCWRQTRRRQVGVVCPLRWLMMFMSTWTCTGVKAVTQTGCGRSLSLLFTIIQCCEVSEDFENRGRTLFFSLTLVRPDSNQFDSWLASNVWIVFTSVLKQWGPFLASFSFSLTVVTQTRNMRGERAGWHAGTKPETLWLSGPHLKHSSTSTSLICWFVMENTLGEKK